MSPTDYFPPGFFASLGALCGFVVFSMAMVAIYLFTAGVASTLNRRPQINEYHLHDAEDDGDREGRNGFGRYGRE